MKLLQTHFFAAILLWRKTFCILCAFACAITAAELPPRPQSPVADYANVINAAGQAKLASLAQSLWEQAGFSLVIATFQGIGGEAIDDYAVRLYQHWGIGAQGKDEGALVVLALDLRKVRIEVGYGAEGYLNDAKIGRILDEHGIPAFRQNRFGDGLAAVSAAIAQVVAAEKGVTLTLPGYGGAPDMRNVKLSWFQMLAMLVIIAFLLGTRMGRTILWMMLISGMSRGSGRLGGLSSSFGGGFRGGFGGGMSGGGGASRGF